MGSDADRLREIADQMGYHGSTVFDAASCAAELRSLAARLSSAPAPLAVPGEVREAADEILTEVHASHHLAEDPQTCQWVSCVVARWILSLPAAPEAQEPAK